MNRRGFLTTLIGGVAATAAVRTWPFRVYSFPAEIERAPWLDTLTAKELDQLNRLTLKYFNPRLADEIFKPSPMFSYLTKDGLLDPYGLHRG